MLLYFGTPLASKRDEQSFNKLYNTLCIKHVMRREREKKEKRRRKRKKKRKKEKRDEEITSGL